MIKNFTVNATTIFSKMSRYIPHVGAAIPSLLVIQ